MRLWNLVCGLIALGLSVAQFLAATGRFSLPGWPFVRSDSHAWKLAQAVLWLAIALVLLATSF
jgi:hypothetical protein